MRNVSHSAVVAAAVAAFAALSASAAEVNGPKLEWKFSTWGNQRAFTKGIEVLAAIVSKKTDGNFTIRIGYGESFSKARENLDGIKLGALDGAHFCNFYHPGKNPAFMVFSLPFLPLGDWNGRYFQTGCGGFCGAVPIASCGQALTRGFAVAAEDPWLVLSAPVPATKKLLERSGMTVGDFDSIECNEAFAAIALMWAREFQPAMARSKPRGGAIALGPPPAATPCGRGAPPP